MKIEFVKQAGALRAVVDPSSAPLAWYLEQDLQASVEHCDKVLAECARVTQSGGEWSGTGNAHTVTINPQRVLIENEYVEGEKGACELTTADFIAAVTAWRDEVRRRARKKSRTRLV